MRIRAAATDVFAGWPGALERVLDMLEGFGADYTVDPSGNVMIMRQAVESARMGWRLCTVAGVAAASSPTRRSP
jgi:S-(hydroxymethyl)glutathione dehydrogenase/alcohol dehydrogenase